MNTNILLAGEWVAGRGTPLEPVNPTDGKALQKIGTASAKQVAQAIEAGAAAVPEWSRTTPLARAEILHRFAAKMLASVDELARLQMLENGKTLSESVGQVKAAAGIVRYFAAVCETLESELTPPRGNYISMTLHEPMGVVAAITPWNSPLTLGAQKLAPALAAGNAVILKPSELTSQVSLEMGRLLLEAGLPGALLSVLPGGRETGEALVNHPAIGMIAFTGGTETGRAIAKAASARFVPTVLELGGKSPHIVLEDADLERAAATVTAAIFEANGQSCIAGSRLFAQESVFETVLEKVVAKAEALRLGPPDLPETQLGPLASFPHRQRIAGMVEAAVAAGAQVVTGGRPPQEAQFDQGAYYLPTVLRNVQNQDRICQEELFGPVLCAMSFSDEQQLIQLANDSVFGLACGIWTADYRKAWRIARAVQAGTVWINTYKQLSIAAPFGGFKESGLGREKGVQGLRIYQQPKSVYWSLD